MEPFGRTGKTGANMNVRILDKRRFIDAMKQQLTVNPMTTALVLIDMHQGHFDPEVGHIIIPEDERKRILKNSKSLIEIVRGYTIPIIHVIVNLRPIERKRRLNPFSGCAHVGERGDQTSHDAY